MRRRIVLKSAAHQRRVLVMRRVRQLVRLAALVAFVVLVVWGR